MRGISEEMIEKSTYAMSLYTLAKTKNRMVCVHCGKPIVLCDRCYGPTWQIIITCIGDGFVHDEKGHFHHCSRITNTRNCKESLKTLNTVAFPVLTDDEKRRLEHSKGPKMNEKVYAFIAWDDEDDKKVVILCKTEELADKLQDNYIKYGEWDHTKVEAMNIYDSLLDAEGRLI